MANIVTSEDFKGTIQLDTTRTDTVTQLDETISEFEPQILSSLFGLSAVKKIYDSLELDINPLEDFLKGGYYVNLDGKDVYFEGLVKTLANFLYFYYIIDSESVNTSVGDVTLNALNGTAVLNRTKLINTFNKAIDLSVNLFDYINANKELFNNDIETNEYEKLNFIGL